MSCIAMTKKGMSCKNNRMDGLDVCKKHMKKLDKENDESGNKELQTEIDISKILVLPNHYNQEFIDFCVKNKLNPPNIQSKNGIALSVMLLYKKYYWTRTTCDIFCKKFNIETKDSIQLFNKHSQWGIKTNSGIEKGKLYIVYPYQLSEKYNIRSNFRYQGTVDEKNSEINKIKSTIKFDYIDVENEKWQLGHKNPCIPQISELETNNLILQPPIQSKYRDDYIFIDVLTKIPLPKKLKKMIEKKEIVFTQQQIQDYINLFTQMS